MLALTFDSTLKFGDLLTSLSVLLSAGALLYAWTKDRALRRREQANVVRTAAAEALAKLTRWSQLPISLGDNVQDLMIETSEVLAETSNVGKARDYLWKGLNAARRIVAEQQRKEDIESASVGLYGRRPEAYEWFERTLKTLRHATDDAFSQLEEQTQERVLAYETKLDDSQPAFLGDDLRRSVSEYERKLEEDLSTVLSDARARLGAVISATDEQVLDREWRPQTAA